MKENWLVKMGRSMKAQGHKENGEINIGGILIMGIGMVFIAVGFIIFPIIMDACDDLLDWTCTANGSITDATFTGFTEVVGIVPLLVLVGFLTAGVFAMYLGIQVTKGSGGTKLDLGTMILLALAMIFIAIALIILPVALEAICTVLTGDGSGISSSYTGLSPILLVTPLLILVAFIGGAIVAGFFGLKRIGPSNM